MSFSRRSHLGDGPNALSRALAARTAGRPLLDLTRSNPTTAGVAYATDAIRSALAAATGVEYSPDPRGLPSARHAVSRLWAERGHQVDPDHVVLTASTSEAYSYLFKLLCDPGDEVLVPQPSYPLIEHLARLEGVRVCPYRLAYDGAWHVDFDSLARATTERARAVVTVCPNNPTGSYLDASELGRLGQLGLPVISDEVFATFPLEPRAGRIDSALSLADAPLFVLDGLSKLAGLPHLKLGWITVSGARSDVLGGVERLEHIVDAFLSANGMTQRALPGLLEARGTAHAAIASRLATNLETLRQATLDTAVTCLRVEGGWYAPIRLPNVLDEARWVLDLLERDVLVQPGWFYDFDFEPVVVVSLLTPPEDLARGIDVILDAVAQAI